MDKREKFVNLIIADMVSKTDIMFVKEDYDPECRYLVIAPWFDGCWSNDEYRYGFDSYIEKKYGFKSSGKWNDLMTPTVVWNKYVSIVYKTMKEPLQINEGKLEGKLERYHQHIVKDLIKKTDITINDYDDLSRSSRYHVKFPWERLIIGGDYITVDFVLKEIGSFFVYAETHYGATTNDALTILVMFARELEKQYGK